jgi:hypothetical protein
MTLQTHEGGASIDTEDDYGALPEPAQMMALAELGRIVLYVLAGALLLFAAVNWPVLWPLI